MGYSTGTVTVTIYPARDGRVESQVTHLVVTRDLCDYLNFDTCVPLFFSESRDDAGPSTVGITNRQNQEACERQAEGLLELFIN